VAPLLVTTDLLAVALAERELDVRQTWQGLAAGYARAIGQTPQG